MSSLLQDRYGRQGTSGRRRVLLAAAAVALAASLAFISWITLAQGPTVNYDDIGFSVVSDAEIKVTFDAQFSGDGAKAEAAADRPTAICTIHALNVLRTEVGLQDVEVKAGPGGSVRSTVTLATSERATTGLVKSCTRAPR